MARPGRAKLVPPKPEPKKNQSLETLEDFDPNQKEEPVLTELDNEIECPNCHEFMKLHSSFDKLVYTFESCSSLLKCV